MNFFEKILSDLAMQMDSPESYGWFHLMFVFLTIVASVALCCRQRDASDKTVRLICLVGWLLMVVGEVLKQIVYTYEIVDGAIVADFQWYAFPYQLCSTPLYVLPLVIFLKDGLVRDAATAYMIAFSIFGGLCVYVFPGDVFGTNYAVVCLQTMVHHGLQIVLGVYLASRYRAKLNYKYYLKGGVVFVALLVVAMIMNIAVHNALAGAGIDETFNMFYISPYFDCTLPLLSLIYPKVPYPVFLAIYVVGFIAAAAIIFYAAKGIVYLLHKASLKKEIPDEA